MRSAPAATARGISVKFSAQNSLINKISSPICLFDYLDYTISYLKINLKIVYTKMYIRVTINVLKDKLF
ncbi:hypothetical protein GCM10019814_05880 [Lactococcus raffinolactis]|jgi:hypothetical protein